MGAGTGRTGAGGGKSFPSVDSSPSHTLADEDGYFSKQKFSHQTQAAINAYLDPNPSGFSLYAPSQQLNHALKQGHQLTPSQQQMHNDLMAGMHNLGENLQLTRYTRVGFMSDLGAPNFDKQSIRTLQKKLVGQVFIDKAFVSVSANNFAKAPRHNPFTDKAVKLNIKAPAHAKALMPGTGTGGNFGEMVLAPNQSYRVTGVRFTGKTGRSGSNYYKQIELDIDML